MADEDGEERDHDFIEDIPNFLTCAICLSVLKDPYQTPCGHRFCSKCIRPVMASDNSVCPTDRKEINTGNTFPDNAVKLQINGLKVRCPMAARGCEWTGELCNEAAHLSRCPHARVELICACVCACVMNEPLVHSSMHAQYILPLNWSRSSVYVGVRLIALAPITKPLLYETLYLTSQEQIIITTCCICW